MGRTRLARSCHRRTALADRLHRPPAECVTHRVRGRIALAGAREAPPLPLPGLPADETEVSELRHLPDAGNGENPGKPFEAGQFAPDACEGIDAHLPICRGLPSSG